MDIKYIAEKDPEGCPFELKITDHILDNVYGHIGITTIERKLERLPLFKRLHNISQLGLTNLVFPCALHNRYVHSIGVMYMASEMAKHINENVDPQYAFSDLEIQILRLAGMLHDIGHYPMSHNIEIAYRNQTLLGEEKITPVSKKLKDLFGCPDYLSPMTIEDSANQGADYWKDEDYSEKKYSGSKDYHHEAVGKQIIISNYSIRDEVRNHFVTYPCNDTGDIRYVRKEFVPLKDQGRNEFTEAQVNKYTTDLLTMIAEIVVGNYEYKHHKNGDDNYCSYKEKYSAMVQIMHSELDADNIDYLLRDALFSGTSYGFMDVSVLLNCLTMVPFSHKNYVITKDEIVTDYLVGILPKGVGCVDQFFQNKYLAYTQMIMSKYVSSLEFMLLRWAQKELTGDRIYGKWGIGDCSKDENKDGLLNMVSAHNTSYEFLQFTDSYVMNRLFSHYSHHGSMSNTLLEAILNRLTNYTAFEVDKPETITGASTSDVSCAEFGRGIIAQRIKKTDIYKQFSEIINQYGETKLADLYNTPREKELYSFRFEERCLTNQLPYDDFYKFVFKNKDGSSKQKDKICAFQNHFFRLSDGIPVLTKKEYIYKLNWNNKNGRYYAKDCIPELVVDYAGSHLHDTYKQITVFLRKYQIRTFEEAFETEN